MSLTSRSLCGLSCRCNGISRFTRFEPRILLGRFRPPSSRTCHCPRHQDITTRPLYYTPYRSLSTSETITSSNEALPIVPNGGSISRRILPLPLTCPGCGALSQEINEGEAGFYSRSRKSVKTYLNHGHTTGTSPAECTGGAGEYHTRESPNSQQRSDKIDEPDTVKLETPVCDRCHDLVYNNRGQPIIHPSIQDLAETIAESPFNRNHVYHILDAADFPMSLIPNIFKTLDLAKPRSQNRRARTKFTSKPTVSFVITRSDLLGPSKTMVDKMMPYFKSTLRRALGRSARDIRLGNVHLVSAKRGWWTKDLKDGIWERGGGNWMLGRVNVGKSNLFPLLFPKGSGERAPAYDELQAKNNEEAHKRAVEVVSKSLMEDSLLPPAQPETRFPVMPIVSHLPGTTASPIRLSFGNHRGELVDLPGLQRGGLEDFVSPEHKLSLMMQYRPNVQQYVIKAGQSLLLGGGLIRVTPELDPDDPSTTMLAYPFVPIEAHVTSTKKAIAVQLQQQESSLKSILADGMGIQIASSGFYDLDTDVTRRQASSVLRAGVPLSKLPFRVYSTDILIEGIGWIELVCQARRNRSPSKQLPTAPLQTTRPESDASAFDLVKEDLHNSIDKISEPSQDFKPYFEQPISAIGTTMQANKNEFFIPRIECFSPKGNHIGQREPLGAWMLWHEERTMQRRGTAKPIKRPRKSMKGAKRNERNNVKSDDTRSL